MQKRNLRVGGEVRGSSGKCGSRASTLLRDRWHSVQEPWRDHIKVSLWGQGGHPSCRVRSVSEFEGRNQAERGIGRLDVVQENLEVFATNLKASEHVMDKLDGTTEKNWTRC